MALKSKNPNQVRPTVPVEMAAKGEQVRVNLNVHRTVRERWKIEAIKRGMNLSDFIVAAVEQYAKH
jgi:hypothetical protein